MEDDHLKRPMIDWLPNGLVRHSLPAPRGLMIDGVEKVLDIGCGVRPMGWFVPSRHICVDIHMPYIQRVRAARAGHKAYCCTAKDFLAAMDPGSVDAIYLLDVIEHMDKAVGEEVVDLALAAGPKQIVIFTPSGFLEQPAEDVWKLGGGKWQEHVSAWLPEEFPAPDWECSRYGRGFYAVWTSR